MPMRSIHLALAGAIWLLPSAAAAVSAADSAAAQALFDDAKKLMAEGNHAAACPKLEESQRLDPGIGTLFNLANCYEQLGKAASAWSLFLEVAASARATGQSEREQVARERAAALAPKLAKIVIHVPHADKTPGVAIKRGDATVGKAAWGSAVPADAGAHTVTASAPGYRTWTSEVTISAGGELLEVTVPELEREPAAPASTEQVAEPSPAEEAPQPSLLPWILVGGGVAVGIGGGVTALLAADKANSAADERDRDAYDSAKTIVLIGDVLIGVGAATAIAGVALLAASGSSPPGDTAWRAAPWVGESSAGAMLRGRW
jgi:tetratricopeptide (TPR) repeat protein